jgi:hypothetical protein
MTPHDRAPGGKRTKTLVPGRHLSHSTGMDAARPPLGLPDTVGHGLLNEKRDVCPSENRLAGLAQ